LPFFIFLGITFNCEVGILYGQDTNPKCAVEQFAGAIFGGNGLLTLSSSTLNASFAGESKCSGVLMLGEQLKNLVDRLDAIDEMVEDKKIKSCASETKDNLTSITNITVSYKLSKSNKIQILHVSSPFLGGKDDSLAEWMRSGEIKKDLNYYESIAQMDDDNILDFFRRCEPEISNRTVQNNDQVTKATIVDTLLSKAKGCFNVSPMAREADFPVRIHFLLNVDGTVNGVPEILDSNADPVFDATAQAAVSALLECQSYQLPPDQYVLWRESTLDFNPRALFSAK
jgi:hypothetical protein